TCLVIALYSITIVSAQALSSVIKAQALDMARAIQAKDIEKAAQYFPPKLVAASGGREKFLAAKDSMNKYMQQFGAEIKKITIGNPGKIVSSDNILQTTLPQTTEVTFMQSFVTLETTWIAYSEDKGKHWYFVDANMYRSPRFKDLLPALSKDLVIPPQKKPEFKSVQ
ncbi:MAG: hypothetical protein JST39_01245, partial [Bacteroidetes bacterium]|nr:hypothetical protein [Bacteroidota bacterium]